MPLTGAYLADAYVGRAKMTLLCTSLRSVAVGICVLSAALLHRGSGTTDNDSTIDVVVIATYTAAALLTCISQLGRGSTLVLIADQMQETTHYVADVVRDATSDDNKIQSSYKSNMLEPEALETVCHNIMDPSSTEARYTSNNIKRGKRQNTSRPHVLLSWALYCESKLTYSSNIRRAESYRTTLYIYRCRLQRGRKHDFPRCVEQRRQELVDIILPSRMFGVQSRCPLYRRRHPPVRTCAHLSSAVRTYRPRNSNA